MFFTPLWKPVQPSLPTVDSPERQAFREALALTSYVETRRTGMINDQCHYEWYPAASARDDAPVIIFLAGIGTYCELYAPLLSGISQQGFHVIGLDYPGHGYSSGERGAVSVSEITNAVSALIDQFQSPSRNIGIYGYSIGAMFAYAAALSDARITAIQCGTLLLPQYPPNTMHQLGWHWLQSSAFWAPHVTVPLHRFLDLESLLKQHPAGGMIKDDPLMVMEYPMRTLANLFSWKSHSVADCKGMIVHGSQDEVLPIHYSEQLLLEHVPDFELTRLEDAGHMYPWTEAEKAIRVASEWFKRTL